MRNRHIDELLSQSQAAFWNTHMLLRVQFTSRHAWENARKDIRSSAWLNYFLASLHEDELRKLLDYFGISKRKYALQDPERARRRAANILEKMFVPQTIRGRRIDRNVDSVCCMNLNSKLLRLQDTSTEVIPIDGKRYGAAALRFRSTNSLGIFELVDTATLGVIRRGDYDTVTAVLRNVENP